MDREKAPRLLLSGSATGKEDVFVMLLQLLLQLLLSFCCCCLFWCCTSPKDHKGRGPDKHGGDTVISMHFYSGKSPFFPFSHYLLLLSSFRRKRLQLRLIKSSL